MKCLICGAGRTADALLERLDTGWTVKLVDKDAERVNVLHARHPWLAGAEEGDASSRLVLERMGLAGQDYVLALTDDEAANRAIADMAVAAGVRHVLMVSHAYGAASRDLSPHIRVVAPRHMAAREIAAYLQDPRVTAHSLAEGRAELLELELGPQHWVAGQRVGLFQHRSWRVAGLVREGRLLSAGEDTLIEPGDRLLILGEPNLYQPICSLMECAQTHFPLEYGTTLVAALGERTPQAETTAVLGAAAALMASTKAGTALVLSEGPKAPETPPGLDAEIRTDQAELFDSLPDICEVEQAGIAVVPSSYGEAVIPGIRRSPLMRLAHELPCPLFVARGVGPYKSILAPFRGLPADEMALEAALDLSKQFGAGVTVAVVEEPEFTHAEVAAQKGAPRTSEGEDRADWSRAVMAKARELARGLQVRIRERVLSGNPVTEVVRLAEEEGHDLLVMGSVRRETGLFTPHVGELWARKAPCCVLVLTP